MYLDNLQVVEGVSDKRIKGRITLDMVKMSLKDALRDSGFAIAITDDEVVSGGFFNKQVERSIVIKNKDHTADYFYYVLFVRHVGNFTTLHIRLGGESPLSQAKHREDEKKDTLLGAFGVYKVDQGKFDAEYLYYSVVDQAINELVEQ